MTLKNKVFNISASQCFADVIAARFLDQYQDKILELADVTFLLPNRRACLSLREAFVRRQGMEPTLLPKMLPLGEIEEDELILTGSPQENVLADLPPAIERSERLMLFIKIIMAKPGEFGLEKMSLNQACYLAQELAGLIDTVNSEHLSFENLKNLVPAEYAVHWQETLKFLEIITRFWPQILKERGLADPSQRREKLLAAQCRLWEANPPRHRLIAAGTTATYPAMKELIKTLLSLEQGELILAGLDRHLDQESWAAVDETHPQYELKQLLDYLRLSRQDVVDFAPPANEQREKLIAEIMRPAQTTDKWRDIKNRGIGVAAVGGLTLADCRDVREEALVIALIMREALETPEKTAALVTPDRNLARRVAAELQRWNIKVDDSAGRPLSLTPQGVFLRLIAQAALPGADKTVILSLLKHPLTGLGRDYASVRREARRLEQQVWRQAQTDPGAEQLIDELTRQLGDFYSLCRSGQADLKILLEKHLQAAEQLAATAEHSGSQLLWRGDSGEAAAEFIASWYEQAGVLSEIEVAEYPALLETMMAGVPVRPKYGTHPRLKILGPIEARLTHYDTIILGELNEGTWPQAPQSDPWLSRPMKKDFGFPQPEKPIGILGLDFCNLLGAREVYLTRAERVQGTPMVKSRWWMRMETVLKALDIPFAKIEDVVYRLWARELDRPSALAKASAPAPRPPVSARPRQLSASAVELLMRDPYSVYARHILHLKKLKDLDQELTMADYGIIIHAVLEEFNNLYPADLPHNAEQILLDLGRAHFAKNNLALERRAFWWPAFERIAARLAEVEKEYRPQIKKVHNELNGSFCFEAPAGQFTVTAKADRVDETTEGKINIIDYKTGKIRSPKEIKAGYAPQLPIEGLIAQKGGFGALPAAAVDKLIYWQLGKKETEVCDDMAQILENTEQNLHRLINIFDFESTAYICHPNPKKIPEYSDYEHLARVKEWATQTADEES